MFNHVGPVHVTVPSPTAIIIFIELVSPVAEYKWLFQHIYFYRTSCVKINHSDRKLADSHFSFFYARLAITLE